MKKVFFGILALALLAFGVYAVLPLFNKIEVDDALPENILSNMEAEMERAVQEDPVVQNEDMPKTATSAETRFEVVDTPTHPAEGYVRVVPTTTGTVIRFEEYSTINGPDLHVYLSKDLEANEYIDLGEVRGTEGNINYEVPANIDVSEYPYVLVWCEPFGVLFNYAELN